jgi:hypothetical protein
MDPTMGQSVIGQAVFGGAENNDAPAIGMSGYLSVADMQADQQAAGTEASGLTGVEADTVVGDEVSTEAALAAVVEEPAAPAPAAPAIVYPSGLVDFNKPFQVFDANDDSDVHTDAKIIAVLKGNAYPVVIVSHHGGEQVVGQFDTDGDEMNGELKVENLETEPVTRYGVLIKQGRDYSLHDELFKSEHEAGDVSLDYDQSIALVFPITIPVPGTAPFNDVPGLPQGTEAIEEEDDHVVPTTAAPVEPPHPDARWVNGRLIKPGDKVRATKRGDLAERVCTVIKTQDDHKRTLFIQADDGSNGPYWALNSKIRPYHGF